MGFGTFFPYLHDFHKFTNTREKEYEEGMMKFMMRCKNHKGSNKSRAWSRKGEHGEEDPGLGKGQEKVSEVIRFARSMVESYPRSIHL